MQSWHIPVCHQTCHTVLEVASQLRSSLGCNEKEWSRQKCKWYNTQRIYNVFNYVCLNEFGSKICKKCGAAGPPVEEGMVRQPAGFMKDAQSPVSPAQQAQVWSVTGFFMAPQAAVGGSLLWESPAVSLGLCSWLHSCCSFATQHATKTWHVSLSQESAPWSVLSFFCPSSWSCQMRSSLWELEEPSTMSAWMLEKKPWNLTFISCCWERASCAACCDV